MPDQVREYIYARQRQIHAERARLAQLERELMAMSDAEAERAQATYDRLLPVQDAVVDDPDEPLLRPALDDKSWLETEPVGRPNALYNPVVWLAALMLWALIIGGLVMIR